jgi:hypothetical protein
MLAHLDGQERARFLAALEGLDPGKWRLEPRHGIPDEELDEDYFVAKTEQLRQLMVFRRKLDESRTEPGRRLTADHVVELLFGLSDGNRERFATFLAGFKPTGDPWRDRARLLDIAFRLLWAEHNPMLRKASKVDARNQTLAEAMRELGLDPGAHKSFGKQEWAKIRQLALKKNPKVFSFSTKATTKRNASGPQCVNVKTIKNSFIPPQTP